MGLAVLMNDAAIRYNILTCMPFVHTIRDELRLGSD